MEYRDLEFLVKPCAKPRMTQRDRWAKRPVVLRYYEYKDAMKECACNNNYKVSDILSLTFVIPFPKSYSKKKMAQLDGKPHQLKPDLDNLMKAFKDSLCDDDSFVHQYVNVKKIWGYEGKTIIHEIIQETTDETTE